MDLFVADIDPTNSKSTLAPKDIEHHFCRPPAPPTPLATAQTANILAKAQPYRSELELIYYFIFALRMCQDSHWQWQ